MSLETSRFSALRHFGSDSAEPVLTNLYRLQPILSDMRHVFRVPALRNIALIALAALALSACGRSAGLQERPAPAKAQFTGPFPSDFAIHGIDVSKYQGEIDWNAVRSSGVEFAWIKATEGGDHADERFMNNWMGAKAAGVPRGAYHFVYWCRTPQEEIGWIKATEGGDHADERFMNNWMGAKAAGVPRGAYHFVYWCRTPQEEIGWFKQTVPVDPDALPPVLDVEATPTSRTCRRTLRREEAIAEMRQMLIDMERHYGKRPII